MTRISIALVLLGCMVSALEASLPSNGEIDTVFRTAENYKAIHSQLSDLRADLYWHRNVYPSGEVSRVYYCLMTNLVERRLPTNIGIRVSYSPKMRLLNSVFKFEGVESDVDALNYCADYINTIRPLSTNEYAVEWQQAHAATNLPAFRTRWNGIWTYNSCLSTYRNFVLEEFWLPISHYIKRLPEGETEAFKTNIATRAGLSPEETEKLFDPEDRVFKPSVPPELSVWANEQVE